ncbi:MULTISPECIES: serine hydrolase domain-containing protein [Arenibacter]|uniref:serine hydrolase domain-containing protein n=1 Tax=Arenibacter TaxID=178469 RepID=UPI00068C0A70|nr:MULTISPECIES: serine hydrolase domain-containing protein [Arenibacter]GBF18203.1 penicillin-binding protein 4* [Arenibacter sp. NBRC 103722]
MKKYLPIVLLLLISGCNKAKVAFNGQKDYAPNITEVQSQNIFAETKDFPNNTQLSLAIIKDGTTKFYGVKRENDTIFTINNHDGVFEIGSISKVFTATLLADMVVNNQLGLDDNINDYLEWPLKDGVEITFKQLSNHTSGLPRLPTNLLLDSVDLENPYKDYDDLKLKQYLTQELQLSQNPGEKSEYSNLGVGLLGFILSEIDSTSYENLLQSKICSKYNMGHTTTNRNLIKAQLINGLDVNGKETPNWDLNVLMGAGGIVSSVTDLSKFAQAQFNDSNQVLALTREPTFNLQANKADIGLGWFIQKKIEEDWIMHSGGTGGYRSHMVLDIANKNGVIILSNISAADKNSMNIDNLGTRLMGTLKKSHLMAQQ